MNSWLKLLESILVVCSDMYIFTPLSSIACIVLDKASMPLVTFSSMPSLIGYYFLIRALIALLIMLNLWSNFLFSGCSKRFSFIATLVGIDPSVKQSGEFFGTQNKMSKRGSPHLRRTIWLAATVAAFHDPVLITYYQKKRAEGKNHYTAIGAVARKLVMIIYAVLHNDKPYVHNCYALIPLHRLHFEGFLSCILSHSKNFSSFLFLSIDF